MQTAQPNSSPIAAWTPVIHGVITGVATAFGATVNFTSSASTQQTAQAPGEVQVTPSPAPVELEARLNRMESIPENLSSTVNTLANTVAQQGKILEVLATNSKKNKMIHLVQTMVILLVHLLLLLTLL